MSWLRSHLEQARVIAVVRCDHIPDAVGLTRVLVDAGVPTIELTFTIPDVLRSVEAAAGVPGAVVGVGSVATGDQVRAAQSAGARFVVTPARRPDVEAVCREIGMPYVPGAMTPSEIDDADRSGADCVKVFPIRPFGPRYLTDLLAPMPHLALVPSGGIGLDDAADYLLAGAAAVGVGAITPAPAVERNDLATIAERASAILRSIGDRSTTSPHDD
jgi:2-dehydro-3-deoxyphosphogluconate aldolase / (4S)-4-hydroxy-2-oxoglutarate aldolase